MNSLQVLVVLLSLSITEANYCNIFSEEFQQDVAQRCDIIHKAVVEALKKNHVYKYILHEVFDFQAFHRPPTAIIFHYIVKVTDNRYGHGHMHVTSLSGSVESPRLDENDDNIACETENNCTFDIGWSSANIYTSVRPKFILSLQPAWFLNSLKFSIDEHVGFSRNITLHVPLQIRHNLPVNTTVTVHEIMHFLQRATSKVTITTIMLLIP